MRRAPSALLLILALAPAAPAAADVVHLANGRKFEGVIARVGETSVSIRFDFGEMALPRSLVTAVETEGSELAELEARRAALQRRAAATAQEWLDLARWARSAGLAHGAAQAALRASELDPSLPGVAPLLDALGYGRDEATGAWLRHDELMARRGYRRYRGDWLPAAEVAALEAAEERQAAQRRAAAQEDRLTRAVELFALAEVAEELAESRQPAPVYGVPVAIFPGFFHGKPRRPPDGVPHGRDALDDLLHRNPGSLLPVGEPPSRVIRSRFSRVGPDGR